MPVISPTRYSTTVSSSSYLPPSIGGTTSSLAKSSNYGSPSSYHTSSYRSNSLGSSGYSSGGYSSSYLRASYRSNLSSSPSIYRTSSYLTGGNNDTTATSRFGVSSNRFLRASSDRDTLKLATGKTQYNSNTVNTSRSKALQSKPPIGASSPSIRHQRTSSDSARSRDNSLTRVTSKSDPNSNCINNNDTSELNDQPKSKISSSLSSSSLARQVATSGLELYEKYSPAHYIPKCELSRSRSLSEATSSSNKNSNNDKGLSNSSSNVHQLLQTTRESKQHRQQNQNENDLQNLNIKSSSPPSSSHQTSSPTSAKDISKVKRLCAVSTTATTNTNNYSKFATGSVVVISNNSNANASSAYINKNYLRISNSSTTPSHNLVADLNLSTVSNNSFNGSNSRTIDKTHTTNSTSSLKPSINSSVVNIVTNNPSEHDNKTSSKHSNNNNVIKTATTVQFEQQKTISSLSSNSAINSVNDNSATNQILYKKFQKSNPSIATTPASTTTTFSSSTIASATNKTITPSILSSSATTTATSTATITVSSSSQKKVVSNDSSDKYSSTNNANAILKAAKSNLKPTSKQFLSNKSIDDKSMTSLYSEANDNSNNNNNNSTLNNSSYNKKGISTVITINNSAPPTSKSSSPELTTESVADKTRNYLKNSKSNALDAHLEFCKNKLQPVGTTKVNNVNAANGTGSVKSGINSKFIGLTYREPNFLKTECELARSQVAKSNEEQSFDNNNQLLNGGNNNNLICNGAEKVTSKYEKNLIKPLVHKTTNSKQLQQLPRTPSNNNMNCLQNGGGPDLDDIKYIDSDDSERQQHHGHSYHHNYQSQKKSTTSTSSADVTKSIYSSPSRTLSERKDINYITSSKISTLPLTSKHRDLMYNSDTSKNVTSKYNTLNDFKRLPSNLNSNLRSGFHKNMELISSSSSSSSSPSSTTTTPVKTYATSTTVTAISKSPVVMIHQQQNGTVSHESTPSGSPQILRRRGALTTSNSILQNSNDSLSTSSPSSKAILPQQKSTISNLTSSSQAQPSTTLATSTDLDEQSLSNKICDNDESVRNASIRSALPASPTPSRYYDREGRSSALAAGRSYDTEDPSTSKSSLNSSNSYDRTAAEGLCGLRNIGNTCYMNSVIQCLSHTRELTKFLKSQVGIKSSSKDQQILLEFAKLIREMWSPNVRSVTPLELKSAFSSKHRMYSGYNQQDAQEFLRFFLDSLHCALNAGVKGEQLKIDDSLSDNKKADLTWEWYCKVENSVIRDLFVGQLKSTLKCTTCGNTSVTFDPFWDLSVSLPSSSRCKLDACLDLFIREEILDGDEMPTCSKCQARRKCTKSFTIQRFPKYLAIHLKRFSETRWSKLSNVVEFPTGERELNMAPYASNTNVSATYSLYGIANHMGSTAGGHYVALCKHPVTKKWHEFNDNVVSDDLSESVLVSSSAYLLFYERA